MLGLHYDRFAHFSINIVTLDSEMDVTFARFRDRCTPVNYVAEGISNVALDGRNMTGVSTVSMH